MSKRYSHIKLKGHKGIKEISLMGLGQINILCGKNNSGKTSVLEAVLNDAASHIAILCDGTIIRAF